MKRKAGFVNLNRWKSGRAINQLKKITPGKGKQRTGGKTEEA